MQGRGRDGPAKQCWNNTPDFSFRNFSCCDGSKVLCKHVLPLWKGDGGPWCLILMSLQKAVKTANSFRGHGVWRWFYLSWNLDKVFSFLAQRLLIHKYTWRGTSETQANTRRLVFIQETQAYCICLRNKYIKGILSLGASEGRGFHDWFRTNFFHLLSLSPGNLRTTCWTLSNQQSMTLDALGTSQVPLGTVR